MERPVSTELIEALYSAVNQMLDEDQKVQVPQIYGFNGPPPPFDISMPNQHKSKADFLRELEAVETCLESIERILAQFLPSEEDKAQQDMLASLQTIIDQKMRDFLPGRYLRSSKDMIQNNVALTGGLYSSIFILLDLRTAMGVRHSELKDQEKEFWTVKHRPPDYYARAIALRMARFYGKRTGERPTVGSSGITGAPSTSYTRALKEVFDLLDIESGIRYPAEWAVEHLTEEDLKPKHGDLLGALFGEAHSSSPELKLEEITQLLTAKRQDG